MSTPNLLPEMLPAAPSAHAAPHRPTTKTWSVGSLTYTAGGMCLLMLLLLGGDFAW